MGSSNSCPIPDDAKDVRHYGTAHWPMVYVAGAATGITLIICISLIVLHLQRYRCPKEQRQIIRMVFAPFVFALVGFFEVFSYAIAPYIDPLGDLYEAFGLCALLLLYIQYAAPGGTFDHETLEAVKAAEEGKEVSFDWPRLTWIFVFQYPLTEMLSIIILEATQATGTYCEQSLNPKFGHLWVTIISSVGVAGAVLAILRFHGHMKDRMKVRRGIWKLVAFKIIVGLRFLQSLIFSILLDQNVIKPSDALGYNDVLYGLENTIACAEMAVLSLGFWYAYSSTEYSTDAKPGDARLPIHKAILDAINPWDLIAGIGNMFGLVTHMQRTGGFADWATHKKQAKVAKQAERLTTRRGRGRFQTLDGMESLSQPDRAHGRFGSRV